MSTASHEGTRLNCTAIPPPPHEGPVRSFSQFFILDFLLDEQNGKSSNPCSHAVYCVAGSHHPKQTIDEYGPSKARHQLPALLPQPLDMFYTQPRRNGNSASCYFLYSFYFLALNPRPIAPFPEFLFILFFFLFFSSHALPSLSHDA